LRTNGHGVPIVALDIDGTLADYHTHFLRFAEKWIGKKMPSVYAPNPGRRLWEHMGVDLTTYRECKLAFRQGGLKRWMPAYHRADDLTEFIRHSLGWQVWICTTRPYMRLDNIDPDTREWMRRNNIQYDAVLFDPIGDKGAKYAELKRQAEGRVVAVFDDLPEMYEASSALGFRTWIRDQPYNKHLDVPRVKDCGDMMKELAAYV
jgi:hypothetical protein